MRTLAQIGMPTFWLLVGIFAGICVMWSPRNIECMVTYQIELPPNPNPPRERPVYVASETRLMHAGELVAFWDAWAECSGEACID